MGFADPTLKAQVHCPLGGSIMEAGEYTGALSASLSIPTQLSKCYGCIAIGDSTIIGHIAVAGDVTGSTLDITCNADASNLIVHYFAFGV